jgi:chemotaxis protein MotB
MAKHKGPPHEEHADESWLIPYSDLMTLLLALFIVLFASSTIEESKLQAIQQAFSMEFGYPQASNLIELNPDGGLLPPLIPPAPEPPQPPKTETPGEETGGIGENQMDNLYLSLGRYVTDNELDDKVGVEFDGEKVLITLKSDIWFQSGSAEITGNMVQQAKTLAILLRDNQDDEHPLEIVVTGHTDNVPIHTSKYPSNWYLSMERAFNFLAVLLANSQLDPMTFSARGYGEFHPIATNDTPAGRQQNRRVELLVSRPEMTKQ